MPSVDQKLLSFLNALLQGRFDLLLVSSTPILHMQDTCYVIWIFSRNHPRGLSTPFSSNLHLVRALSDRWRHAAVSSAAVNAIFQGNRSAYVLTADCSHVGAPFPTQREVKSYEPLYRKQH